MAKRKRHTIEKFLDILKYEKTEISSIYFYSILIGLVQLSLPLGIQSIISFVLGGSISTSLILLVAVVIVGVFVSGLLQVNQMKIIEKIQQQLFVRYAFQYTNILPNVDARLLSNKYLPEIVNRFFDTLLLQKSIAKILLDIPAASIQILFGLILLSFYHPVFIFFGVLLLIVLYLILRATGNRGLQTSIKESNFKYMVVAHLQDLARSVLTFKYSKDKKYPTRVTDDHVTGYIKSRTAHFRVLLFQYWALIVFKVLIVASMLIIGGFLLVNQKLNIGQFIAAEIVILSIINSVEKLIIDLDKVYDVLTSVEKISKVLELPIEANGNIELTEGKEGLSIVTENLGLTFENDTNVNENKVLTNIDLNIESGKKICIMGTDSSGRSSLMKLLGSTYNSYTGKFLINDIPTRNYKVSSVREKVGMLLKTHDIFKGSILDNIRGGNEHITLETINKMATIVGLKKFIEHNPDGFEFQIDSYGQNIYADEIKKILLVRALSNEPRLLLLEDPFTDISHEDALRLSDYLLMSTNSTVVVATEDITFAKKCDRVYKLENGTITPINL